MIKTNSWLKNKQSVGIKRKQTKKKQEKVQKQYNDRNPNGL